MFKKLALRYKAIRASPYFSTILMFGMVCIAVAFILILYMAMHNP